MAIFIPLTFYAAFLKMKNSPTSACIFISDNVCLYGTYASVWQLVFVIFPKSYMESFREGKISRCRFEGNFMLEFDASGGNFWDRFRRKLCRFENEKFLCSLTWVCRVSIDRTHKFRSKEEFDWQRSIQRSSFSIVLQNLKYSLLAYSDLSRSGNEWILNNRFNVFVVCVKYLLKK